MSDWRVAVEPIDNDRYCVMLINSRTGDLQGPDGGEDHTGYLLESISEILRNRYSLSADDSQRAIEAADAKRGSENWQAIQRQKAQIAEAEAEQPSDFETVHYQEVEPTCPKCGAGLLIEQAGSDPAQDDRVFCPEHGTIGTRETIAREAAGNVTEGWAGDVLRDIVRKSGF